MCYYWVQFIKNEADNYIGRGNPITGQEWQAFLESIKKMRPDFSQHPYWQELQNYVGNFEYDTNVESSGKRFNLLHEFPT